MNKVICAHEKKVIWDFFIYGREENRATNTDSRTTKRRREGNQKMNISYLNAIILSNDKTDNIQSPNAKLFQATHYLHCN